MLGPAVVFVLLSAVSAAAQTIGDPAVVQGGEASLQVSRRFLEVVRGDYAVGRIPAQYRGNAWLWRDASLNFRGSEPESMPAPQTPAATKQRSATRKVLGAVVGATGGFFAGGFLGAKIEGDRCDCDDPGLIGFLVGAPVGAVAGGILGYKFIF